MLTSWCVQCTAERTDGMLITFVPINAVCFLLSVGSNAGTKPFWGFECQHLLPLISTLSRLCACVCVCIGWLPRSHPVSSFATMGSYGKFLHQSVVKYPRGYSCFSWLSAGFFRCVCARRGVFWVAVRGSCLLCCKTSLCATPVTHRHKHTHTRSQKHTDCRCQGINLSQRRRVPSRD